MTVPVDLVDPTALRDPVEEFFRQGGIDVTVNEQEGITPKQVTAIAVALGASFLVYRALMHRELDNALPPQTKGEGMKLLERAFYRVAPLWARAALPAAIAAYQLGSYDVRTISQVELETLANAYVKSLGEYMHKTSAEAMLDGFQAQMNARWSAELAWQRSVAGYGLDGPGTKAYITALNEGIKTGYIPDPIPQASVKMVEMGLGVRAKRFGDTEAWSSIQTARNVVWMAQEVSGDLPDGMRKRWYTAYDERVCEVCGPLHERVIPLKARFRANNGEKFYAPGVHPNCRCRIELVYPEGYSNRMEELIRKARTYNRDEDGQFARINTLQPRTKVMTLKPVEDRPDPVERVKSVFEEEPVSVFEASSAQSVFSGQSVFAPAAERVRQRVRAEAQPNTVVYLVLNPATKTFSPPPVDDNPPPPPNYPKDPIEDFYLSHDAVISGRLKYMRKERRNADNTYIYTDDPEIGDVIDFEYDGWSYTPDSRLTFSDAISSERERVEARLDADRDALRDYTAKILYGDDYDYGDLTPGEAERVDEHIDMNDDITASAPVILYHFNSPRGDRKGEYHTAYGRYRVVDIDYSPRSYLPPDARDMRDVLVVELEYDEDQ